MITTSRRIDLTVYKIYHIKQKRGDTFYKKFIEVNENTGLPLDLTNYSCELLIQANSRQKEILFSATTQNGNAVITVSTEETSIELFGSAEDMQIQPGIHRYQVRLTSSIGAKTVFYKGNFEIEEDIESPILLPA